MKKIVILLSLVFFLTACATSSFKTEFKFANKLAKNGLWKEAGYRWKKSIESGNISAAVYNNLAVSYEFAGKLKLAMEEYKKALKISPGNKYILENIKKLKIRMGHLKNEKDKLNVEKKKRGGVK